MTARKSPTGLRWERREKDEEEQPQSEQRENEQLFGKLLWIDRVDLCCAQREASSSLGRESETYMKNIKSNLEAPARQPWSDDSRTNASTESCVRGKHCWSSQQAGRQSTVALSSGEAEIGCFVIWSLRRNGSETVVGVRDTVDLILLPSQILCCD